MVKSAADRMRAYRARIKANKDIHEVYKEKDRLRKKDAWDKMDEVEKDSKRKLGRVYTRKWRVNKRVKSRKPDQNLLKVRMPYKSRSSLGKAIARATRGLPQSPHKRAVVVKELASSLGVNIKRDVSELPFQSKNQLAIETTNKIKEFYERDDISRMMPGKADCITVKTADGGKEIRQKRHLIMTVSEAYQLFKENFPELTVGKSKFAALRPQHVLLVSKTPHNVCQCRYHSNVILILESLHKKITTVPLYSKSEFLPLCVCDPNNEDCMASACSECENKIQMLITDLDEEVLSSPIRWSQWGEDVDGYLTTQTHTTTVAQCFESLISQLPQFLWHCFIKQKQAEAYETDKITSHQNDSTTVLVQMDFAENATCMIQDEIQSAHWKQRHVSLYTVMWYYRGAKYSMLILSDSLDHEKRCVSSFTYTVLQEVTLHCPDVKQIKIWTDGPSSQFKNRFIFALVSLFNETIFPDLYITWNYFATSHGKGPNDALGGTAKRIVQRKIMTRQTQVNSALSYAEALRSVSDTIMVKVMNLYNIEDACRIINVDGLWATVPKAIPGVRNTHCVLPLQDGLILTKYYSHSPGGLEKCVRLVPTTDATPNLTHCDATQSSTAGSGVISQVRGLSPVGESTRHAGSVPQQGIDSSTGGVSPPAVVFPTDSGVTTKVVDLPGTLPVLKTRSANDTKSSMGASRHKTKKSRTNKRNPKQQSRATTYPCGKCKVHFGDTTDPLKEEDWIRCNGCKVWHHELCAEDVGIIDDVDVFTCGKCL